MSLGEEFGQALRKPIPILARDLHQSDSIGGLQRVRERMARQLDRRDERCRSIEDAVHGVSKRLGRELHLPQLVHDHDSLGIRRAEGRNADPLENVQVDAILPDFRRPRKLDVCQHAPSAIERHDLESHPPAAFAELASHESGNRQSGIVQERSETVDHGRLPDAWPAFEQKPPRLFHGVNRRQNVLLFSLGG